MKIKYKKFIVIWSITILLIAPIFVHAAPNAGIKPSSIFYFFDTTAEKVSLFFTFNAEKKTRKALEYANERLAEAEVVAEEPKAVEVAMKNYQANIAFATKESKEIKDEGKIEDLLTTITDNTTKHQVILNNVLAKVPDEAKDAILAAIEASKRGQEEAIKQISELKGEVERLKKEVEELKKQQNVESKLVPTAVIPDQSPTIRELKKEIEDLKKQAVEKIEDKEEKKPKEPKPQTQTINSQSVTLTNSSGQSFIFGDTIINRQRVQDLLDLGYSVTKGKLPEGMFIKPSTESSIPATTPTVSESEQKTEQGLQITSINVSTTRTTAQIEWTTNKPSTSKAFISGGDLLSNVYRSESELSTRHVVHILNLTAGNDYSYTLEVIAGKEVIEKNGKFSTNPNDYNIVVSADKTSVPASGFHPIWLKIGLFLNGKCYMHEKQSINITTPDSTQNKTIDNVIVSANAPIENCHVQYTYKPKTVGTHKLEFSWGGTTKIFDIEAFEYIKFEPKIEKRTIYQQDANNSSYPIETPSYPSNYQGATVAAFSLTNSDEPFRVNKITVESDIDTNKLMVPYGPFPTNNNGEETRYTIPINNTSGIPTGIHTVTIKEIRIIGEYSGAYRQVSGLPITFTFEIK